MARIARLIIVPTLNVRDEVCEHLGIPVEKVRVVPYAPRRCFRPVSSNLSTAVRTRLAIEDQFVLYVGTLEPRKNVITLVRALETFHNSNRDRPQLVLAGKTGWLNNEFFEYLKHSNMRDRIILTGYLSDDDLAALYSSCSLMVFPAIYEGAGLPPIEAMACGAPVISTNTPAISEMTGNGARLFTPEDHKQLADQISELLHDDVARRELAERGRARASQFTWENTAKLTHDIYNEALSIV
jgi:glycosyltransferase involved in cell wall biosynthesis